MASKKTSKKRASKKAPSKRASKKAATKRASKKAATKATEPDPVAPKDEAPEITATPIPEADLMPSAPLEPPPAPPKVKVKSAKVKPVVPKVKPAKPKLVAPKLLPMPCTPKAAYGGAMSSSDPELIQRYQLTVLQGSDANYVYMFARNIPGADIRKLGARIRKLDNASLIRRFELLKKK